MAKLAQPKARYLHAATGTGQHMFVWAGEGCRSDVLESFNVVSLSWNDSRQIDVDSVPEFLDSMAVASDENQKTYYFAGYVGEDVDSQDLHNSLYCLDFSEMTCKEIRSSGSVSPSRRADSRMIYHNQKLIVHGGDTGDGASDDLFVFHLDNSEDGSVNDV